MVYFKSIMKEWNADDIKQLRVRFGITQKTLAGLLGVTDIYVGMLERNEKTPSTTLRLLLKYVGKDLKERKRKRKRRD